MDAGDWYNHGNHLNKRWRKPLGKKNAMLFKHLRSFKKGKPLEIQII
jgi:hypothetical protein